MLKKFKQLTLTGLKSTGMFSLFRRSKWRSDRLLILAYHGFSILDEHLWDPQLFMHPDVFENRMNLIKRQGYNVLPLEEAVQRLYARDLPENSLAITIDDGFYDFYKYAHPILSSLGLPSTLYLTTYYVHHSWPVFDAFASYLLWKGRSRRLNLKPLTGQDETVDLSSAEIRTTVTDELVEFTRRTGLSGEEKNALAAKLAGLLHQDFEQLCEMRVLHLLRPEEVSRLASEGVDIQLHTHTHRTPRDQTLFRNEIEKNRESILSMTGESPRHFCYPSGSYRAAFFPWLKDMGVESATTCEVAFAETTNNNLLLPRLVDTSLSSPIEFEGWLCGVSSFLPRGNKSHLQPD